MRILGTDLGGRSFDLGVEREQWAQDALGEPFDLSGLVSVSGLADSHIHLSSEVSDFAPSDPTRLRERIVAELSGGVFLCLDKGWSDDGVLQLLDSPLADRPGIRAAGTIIAGVGGYYPDSVLEVEPADLVAAVSDRDPRGGWVKLIGDWPRRGLGAPPSFDVQALRAAVDAAHGIGARVAIHTMAPDTPSMAVAAGVDSIEHGLFLTDEDVRILGDRGGAWVPTVCQVEHVIETIGADRTGGRLLREGLDRVRSLAGTASESGVVILGGSDFGIPVGSIGEEAAGLTRYGFSHADAIAAVTTAAYDYVGEAQGFEEGLGADLVAFERHPLEHIDTLADPVFVMRRGRVLRDRRSE